MKAWFLEGPNKPVLREIPEPELKPGFVVAKVLTTQASVTEANMLSLEGNPFGILDRIKATGGVTLPGHEVCAQIVRVNPDSEFAPGDRVSTLSGTTCGTCWHCQYGNPKNCESKNLLGITINGTFQEYISLPESGLIKVPENLTNAEAANLQPISDCVCAVDSLISFRLGVNVAVFGAGCLGLNVMQICNASGAGKTIVVDVKEENLALAKELGATHVINSNECDPVEEIKKLTGGVGADIAFDCAGGNPKMGLAGTIVLQQAAKSIRVNGELHVLAMYGPSVEFPIGELRMNGKCLSMSCNATTMHLKRAADLLASGQVKVAPMITHSFNGIESVPEMFDVTANKGKYHALNPAQVVINEV